MNSSHLAQKPSSSSEETLDPNEDLPALTPAARAFAEIPLGGFAKSLAYLSSHRQLLRNKEKWTDAYLAEAFMCGMRSEAVKAKQCVHQGLMLQYIDKLGPDGVALFFQRSVFLS